MTIGENGLAMIHELPDILTTTVISVPEEFEELGRCSLNHK